MIQLLILFIFGVSSLFAQRVIVKFKVDSPIENRQLSSQNLSGLKAQIEKSFLDVFGLKTQGLATKNLWIADSVSMELSREEQKRIRTHPKVKGIYPVEEWSLEIPPQSTLKEINERETTYGLGLIQAPEVWSQGITGKGVKVGILDSGWADHPDLNGKVLLSRDFISSYEDNVPNDGHGHGSHCMGSIGGGNASGKSIGVAPDVRFYSAKIFSDTGRTDTEAILAAMQWMTDPNQDGSSEDAPVLVSNSWGRLAGSKESEQVFWDAVDRWVELGIFPLFSAGNSGPRMGSMGSPGGFPHSFAVGAVDSNREIARFSSRGPIRWEGVKYIKPDAVAPGVQIYSVSNEGGYSVKDGTSMAGPHVAGAIALLAQANPYTSSFRFSHVLEATAMELGEEGKDGNYGSGLIQVKDAVDQLQQDALFELTLNLDGEGFSGRIQFEAEVDGENFSWELLRQERYRFSLPAGATSLKASVYGFDQAQWSGETNSKELSKINLHLKEAELKRVQLTLEKDLSEEGLLEFLNVPEPSKTLSTNREILLPDGQYQIAWRARGFESQILEFEVNASRELELPLVPVSDVLLVDDDRNKNYERVYLEHLDELGYSVKRVKKAPNLFELSAYPVVLVQTGGAPGGILVRRDQKNIESYVKEGGVALLFGQDIMRTTKRHGFLEDVAGVRFLKDRANGETMSGFGQSFSLNGHGSMKNQKSVDLGRALNSEVETLLEISGEGGVLFHRALGHGKLFIAGFGLEGVGPVAHQKKLLSKLLQRAQLGPEELVHAISQSEDARKKHFVKFHLAGRKASALKSQLLELPASEARRVLLDYLQKRD